MGSGVQGQPACACHSARQRKQIRPGKAELPLRGSDSPVQYVQCQKSAEYGRDRGRQPLQQQQAVSGAGIGGIQDLESGLENYVCNSRYTLKKFPYKIFNNCIPHIDDFTPDGYTKEEHKMINETRKILNKPDLPITATTVRVPVFNSHSESINVEFEEDFDLEELIQILKKAPGVVVLDDVKNNIYPMTINSNDHDEVYVGRIRRDYSVKYGVNLWVVADNTRKGAASNAVQILEKLIEDKSK